MHEIRTVLFDEHGRETDDPTRAVRGEVVELEDGVVVKTYREGGLAWHVDPIALDGDEGELATRPSSPRR